MTEALLKAIDTGDLPALGPEQRASAKSIAALGQAVDALGLCSSTSNLARSATLLWHDHLDASHDISQNLPSADGSFLHGIMHRREPDYPNAKYSTPPLRPDKVVDAVESAMHNGQHVDALQNVQRLEFESLAASILA